MRLLMIGLNNPAPLLLLALLAVSTAAHAAAPFELDLKELDRESSAPATPEKKKPAKAKKAAAKHAKSARQEAPSVGEYTRYTVKPGDHIFKILMSRFGMSNEAAERLIPEIIRINNIGDIRKLTVGETLLIPRRGKAPHAASATQQAKPQPPEKRSESAAMLEKAARLEAEGERAAMPPQAPAPAAAAPARAPEAPAQEAPMTTHALPAAPAVAAPPAAAVPVTGATWICSVAGTDAAGTVDSVLNALAISWSKNRIINSPPGAANTFSIRVDRYFEYGGGRYIVSIGETDPYSYTLVRLLETAGYQTVAIGKGEDFKAVAETLLNFVGIPSDFGRFLLGGRESSGLLVRQEDAGGRQVLITDEPADPRRKWVMRPGCR
jgi:hypothetical protein